MKPHQLLAAIVLAGCAQPPAGNAADNAAPAAAPADEQAAIMDRIEREVRLPEGTRPLGEYGRYYAWQDREDGVRKVIAVYLHEPNPARHWVAETALPLVLDGGCGIVSLSYDVAAGRIEHVACNGEA